MDHTCPTTAHTSPPPLTSSIPLQFPKSPQSTQGSPLLRHDSLTCFSSRGFLNMPQQVVPSRLHCGGRDGVPFGVGDKWICSGFRMCLRKRDMVLTVMVIVYVGHMDCNTRPVFRGMNEKYALCLKSIKSYLSCLKFR